MRVSTYEIILPVIDERNNIVKGKKLLVNGLYGSFDIVSTKVVKYIEENKINSLSNSDYEKLKKRGHITEKTINEEVQDMEILANIYKKIPGRCGVGLVIMPTYDCNFRCPYCFESHRLSNDKKWLEAVMDREMILTVFRGIKNYKERGYDIGNCTLYGGEPLLEKNKDIVKIICECAKEIGININAITNGFELDSYIELMEQYSFGSIQVTIDGVREVNDARRRHKNGLPTYDRIISNIKQTLLHGVDVIVRVNIGKDNIGGMEDLIADIESKKFNKKSTNGKSGKFSYYFKATTEDNNPDLALKEEDILNKLLNIGLDVDSAMKLQGQYSMFYNDIKRCFEKKTYHQYSPSFCGAENGMLVIDPFGKIYSCWDSVAKDEDVVGYADIASNHFIFNFNKAKWRNRTTDKMANCICCPYVFICKGGCASRAYNIHGNYYHEYCGEYREVFNYVASHVAYTNFCKTNQSELTLSLLMPLEKLSYDERKVIIESNSQRDIFNIASKIGLFNNDEFKIGY